MQPMHAPQPHQPQRCLHISQPIRNAESRIPSLRLDTPNKLDRAAGDIIHGGSRMKKKFALLLAFGILAFAGIGCRSMASGIAGGLLAPGP